MFLAKRSSRRGRGGLFLSLCEAKICVRPGDSASTVAERVGEVKSVPPAYLLLPKARSMAPRFTSTCRVEIGYQNGIRRPSEVLYL